MFLGLPCLRSVLVPRAATSDARRLRVGRPRHLSRGLVSPRPSSQQSKSASIAALSHGRGIARRTIRVDLSCAVQYTGVASLDRRTFLLVRPGISLVWRWPLVDARVAAAACRRRRDRGNRADALVRPLWTTLLWLPPLLSSLLSAMKGLRLCHLPPAAKELADRGV